MGISHDPSYATFLEETAQDDFSRQRMTIIEGVPTAHELVDTNIPSLNLGKSLFRNDKPSDKNTAIWPIGSWGPGAAPRTASPATSVGSGSTPCRSPLSYANAASSSSPLPQITLPIPPKPAVSRSSTSKVQYQQIPPQQPVDWNPGPRGLDEPITVSVVAMDSIKKRKESDKLCNNHFLRGPCTKGDSCFFVHDYKPSSEEINAIAVLARQNPCTNAQDCESDECIYGHHVSLVTHRTLCCLLSSRFLILPYPHIPILPYSHQDRANSSQCPSIRDNVCIHPFCKFPEDAHPPGTKFKNPNIKGN
jgi:hypothetical protein